MVACDIFWITIVLLLRCGSIYDLGYDSICVSSYISSYISRCDVSPSRIRLANPPWAALLDSCSLLRLSQAGPRVQKAFRYHQHTPGSGIAKNAANLTL